MAKTSTKSRPETGYQPTVGVAKPKPPRGGTAIEKPPKPKPAIETGVLTRCPACGSTDRDGYHGVVTHPIAGLDSAGKPYTHVVWQRTRCRACGQHRSDKHFENRVCG